MTETEDRLRERLLPWMGRPMSGAGPTDAPDPVNLAMIRHWVDALDDRNPVYLDEAAAIAAGFGGLVAPPTMMQTWTMGRPQIEGIAERGGAPGEVDPDSPWRCWPPRASPARWPPTPPWNSPATCASATGCAPKPPSNRSPNARPLGSARGIS